MRVLVGILSLADSIEIVGRVVATTFAGYGFVLDVSFLSASNYIRLYYLWWCPSYEDCGFDGRLCCGLILAAFVFRSCLSGDGLVGKPRRDRWVRKCYYRCVRL